MNLFTIKSKPDPKVLVSISLSIVILSFFPLFYFQETIQASICTLEGVDSDVRIDPGWIVPWIFQAVCSAERTLDDLFDFTGGGFIALLAVGFFWLCFSKRWRIGLIVCATIVSYQLCAAVLETFTIYHDQHEFGYYLFSSMIAGAAFIISSDYFARREFYKKTRNWLGPVIFLLIAGSIVFSLVAPFWFPQEQPEMKYLIIGVAAHIISGLIIGYYLKTNRILIKHSD